MGTKLDCSPPPYREHSLNWLGGMTLRDLDRLVEPKVRLELDARAGQPAAQTVDVALHSRVVDDEAGGR